MSAPESRPANELWSPGLKKACLGECFGPYASPDTWAKMVADLRAEVARLDVLAEVLRRLLSHADVVETHAGIGLHSLKVSGWCDLSDDEKTVIDAIIGDFGGVA